MAVHLFLEFIFFLSMTGYWFNNIRLHQIGKKFRSAWTFQLKKFHNCTSSKYSIKSKLLKESMDMNRRFYCEIAGFCGKHAFNVHFHTLNVHFFFVQKSTYMKISILMPLLYHNDTIMKNDKICVFESEILHILLANSILSTTMQFRKMKKFNFWKWVTIWKQSRELNISIESLNWMALLTSRSSRVFIDPVSPSWCRRILSIWKRQNKLYQRGLRNYCYKGFGAEICSPGHFGFTTSERIPYG